MTIQFNTDKNLTVHKNFKNKLSAEFTKELSRFSDNITRLEVHLSDENGQKSGKNDKRCLLEAHMESRQPVVVTADADSHDLAVNKAIDKLKSSLDSIVGKLRQY